MPTPENESEYERVVRLVEESPAVDWHTCALKARIAVERIFEKLDPKEYRRAADYLSNMIRGHIPTLEEIKLAENDYLLAFCERACRKLGITEYEFARRQAERNRKRLPRNKQRGAGGVDPDNLYRHIREQRDRQQDAKEQLRRIRRVKVDERGIVQGVSYDQPDEGPGLMDLWRRAGPGV
jgi:hypothetical protein